MSAHLSERELAAARKARFSGKPKADLKNYEGPHRVAHDGGKFRTNKEEALLKFFEKRGKSLDDLNPQEQAGNPHTTSSNHERIAAALEVYVMSGPGWGVAGVLRPGYAGSPVAR